MEAAAAEAAVELDVHAFMPYSKRAGMLARQPVPLGRLGDKVVVRAKLMRHNLKGRLKVRLKSLPPRLALVPLAQRPSIALGRVERDPSSCIAACIVVKASINSNRVRRRWSAALIPASAVRTAQARPSPRPTTMRAPGTSGSSGGGC